MNIFKKIKWDKVTEIEIVLVFIFTNFIKTNDETLSKQNIYDKFKPFV